MRDFSKYLLENIKIRFPIDDIVVLLQILVVENIRKSGLDLPFFGINELDKLLDIFGNDKKCGKETYSKITDPVETRIEWRFFKRLVNNNYLECNKQFWNYILKDSFFSMNYPNIKKLAYIAHVLPMSRAI